MTIGYPNIGMKRAPHQTGNTETPKPKSDLEMKRDKVFDIMSDNMISFGSTAGISCVGREKAAKALDEYIDAMILDRLERYKVLAVRNPLD